MSEAVCLRSGAIVSRVASIDIDASRCPFCGARLRLLTAAELQRPRLRLLPGSAAPSTPVIGQDDAAPGADEPSGFGDDVLPGPAR